MKNLIAQIIQALLTSTSDNLKYAPSGKNVNEKTVSLAKQLDELFLKQSIKLQTTIEQEEVIIAFMLAMLSRNQDTFKLESNLEDWMSKVFINGLDMSKNLDVLCKKVSVR